jgi:hypothetical protein
MSEKYNESNDHPHLTSEEVRTLAEVIMLNKETRVEDVDYPEDQLRDRPRPHHFTLQIDPEPFRILHAKWLHNGFETITNVELEYVDPRVLDISEPLTRPTVFISIASLVYDSVDPTFNIRKDVVYMLPIDVTERALVKESYTDASHSRYELLHDDMREMLEMLAAETRPMNERDVELLRRALYGQ